MATSKVSLIFCEGPHDVAFVGLVLRELQGFKAEKLKLTGLPNPLGQVFTQIIKKHSAEDFRLDMAKKFFMPDKALKSKDHLVLLFNYGGSERKNNLLPFLAQLFLLRKEGRAFGGEEAQFNYLITADADDLGVDLALASISDDLATVDGQNWLTTNWQALDRTFGAIQQDNKDVGAYIWRSEVSDQGTLEDLLCDCLLDHTTFTSAKKTMTETFVWETAHPERKRAIAEVARHHKAAITCMGQREFPGSSMNVVLDKGEFIPSEKLRSTTAVVRLSTFLSNFFGEELTTVIGSPS